MKILVVEDDDNKMRQIRVAVEEKLINAEVLLARSLRSGLEAILKLQPDLVLLDMTIPTYDVGPGEPGGRPQIFGGIEFLQQMDRFEIATPVILVTQFERFGQKQEEMDLEELDAKLRADFGAIYRGAVYYHAAVEGWRAKLIDAISDSLSVLKDRK